ncbi:MAG: methyltransferase, partial [bacterium]|jgi:putative N6-adenine-specific DNA methylase|nr:methyltransferase [bacterium]
MAVEAPLKETLAAAIVQLSFWKTGRLLFDPFCGSGTIPIEAAMIGMNMAPGLKRTFASESWPRIGPDIWKTAREKALSDIDSQAAPAIYASDRDSNAVKIAKENAVRARVEGSIQFLVKDFHDFSFDENYGLLVCNPPYGERVGERVEVERLYRDMGNRLRKLKTWSVYILASHDRFEYLYGKKADRKRKLYNGRIKTNFYQFYGVKPSARQP